MSKNKMFSLLLLIIVVGVFAFMSTNLAEADERPSPVNHPPQCYPIEFLVPGYWGMDCLDEDNNISSVILETESPYVLNWTESYVQMIVKVDKTTEISWSVCDYANACQKGGYP